MSELFQPLVAGDLRLSNRLVMAPLTRARAGASRVPNDLMAEYYRQRAGAGRVGGHLSPRGGSHDISDADPAATFGYVARELGRRGLAFLFVREPERSDALRPALKRAFGGVVVANQGLDAARATEIVKNGEAEAVAFGVGFIANPDLPERIRKGAPWNELDKATLYGPDGREYTDYPSLYAAA